MESLPKIRVSFYILGDQLNVDEVGKKLDILPTRIRLKENFPVKEFGTNTWELRTEAESCKAVEWQFEKILKILRGKEEKIRRVLEEENAEAYFTIAIFMEAGDGPLLELTEEIISFMASINSSVGFDMYIDS